MKVGVISFSEADNYGAMCQLYALQNVINSKICECEIIRYRNESEWLQFHLGKHKKGTPVTSYIKRSIEVVSQLIRRKRFELFRRGLSISRVCDSNNINERMLNYDKVIVGSDQVWNPRNSNGDLVFLLEGCSSKKKIAYAASFGNTAYFKEFGSRVSELLNDFQSISVRENTGKEYLCKEFGIRSQLVLDPVLLLSDKDWGKIACSRKTRKYIFVYQLKPDAEFVHSVSLFAAKKNYDVFVLPYLARCLIQNVCKKRFRLKYNCSPEQFISFIRNAEYVLTDSFHGVALSISMNKEFYVKLNPNKQNTNERIENVLNICGIKNHSFDDMLKESLERIDYSIVNQRINRYREESLLFLSQSIMSDSFAERRG